MSLWILIPTSISIEPNIDEHLDYPYDKYVATLQKKKPKAALLLCVSHIT